MAHKFMTRTPLLSTSIQNRLYTFPAELTSSYDVSAHK